MASPTRSTSVDLDQALLDPGSVFASPEELAARHDLPLEERVEILRRWAYDASEEAVAEEEAMPGANDDLLHRVLLILHRLTGGLDVERVGSSKQHGLTARAIRRR